jgi:Peptidase inhibitor I78 family
MRTFELTLTTVVLAGWLTSGCSNGKGPVTSPSDPIGSVTPPSSDRGPTPPPQPPPASGTCDASKAQWAIGERAGDDVLERARTAAQAATARFIRPNQPITMEFSPGRLNLGLDKRDIVIGVTCG